MRYWLIMPAAGSGRRFGAGSPKQYAALQDRTVIEWALSPFVSDTRCAGIVVALAADDTGWPRIAAQLAGRGVASASGVLPELTTVVGGEHRSLSVRQALARCGRGRRERCTSWAGPSWGAVLAIP